MGKSIDERSHEVVRAYLEHRGIEVLEEMWAHGSDSIDFIALDDGELVFVNTASKRGGHDMPEEEFDQDRFERIAAAYLAEVEVEGLTSIRYDIVSLLAVVPRRRFCATTAASSMTGGIYPGPSSSRQVAISVGLLQVASVHAPRQRLRASRFSCHQPCC